MLSRLSENVVRVFEELEYRVDEDGFVYRPNGSIVSAYIKSGDVSEKRVPYYTLSVRLRGHIEPCEIRIHKLVAYQKYDIRSFEPGILIRHLNGNSLDNSPVNIALGSYSDNMFDIDPGVRLARARHAASYLRSITSEEARVIRETKPPLSEIMRIYGVSKSTASYIRSGKTYVM